MSTDSPDRTRAIILTLTVVVGLAVAAIPLFAALKTSPSQDPPAVSSSSFEGDATPPPPASTDVTVSHRVSCPTGEGDNPASPLSDDAELADVRLPCLTAGNEESATSLAEQLAGKPAVVNVWAWWCAPCRAELPVLQEVAESNPQWNVVGVHLDAKAQAGADFLEELEVDNFASYQDSDHTFDAVTGIPKVVPVTVVYRPDGTRAGTLVRAFEDPAELQQAVEEALGQA